MLLLLLLLLLLLMVVVVVVVEMVFLLRWFSMKNDVLWKCMKMYNTANGEISVVWIVRNNYRWDNIAMVSEPVHTLRPLADLRLTSLRVFQHVPVTRVRGQHVIKNSFLHFAAMSPNTINLYGQIGRWPNSRPKLGRPPLFTYMCLSLTFWVQLTI